MASALLPSSSWSSSMALSLSAASLPRLLRVVPLLLLALTAEAPLPTTAMAVGSSTAGPAVVATRTIIAVGNEGKRRTFCSRANSDTYHLFYQFLSVVPPQKILAIFLGNTILVKLKLWELVII